jgi:hypothetical protein
LIRTTPLWRERDESLRSVPGVGKVLSSALLAQLPELGRRNRKQIAALAGLAPFNRDSGKMRGSRGIWGGRAQVRRVLYMATVAGVRSNPAIRTFYLRLRANGKHAKPALTACMRKFIVILMPCCTTKLIGKHLRSPFQPPPFPPSWARFLNTVAARAATTAMIANRRAHRNHHLRPVASVISGEDTAASRSPQPPVGSCDT